MKPTPDEAREILRKAGADADLLAHVEAVATLALELCQKSPRPVDAELVAAGAFLHDLGRVFTHSIDHAIEGARYLRSLGVDESVVRIVERHVGAGITEQEALQLGWPLDRGYLPQTLEERIVAHADSLTHRTQWVPLKAAVERLQQKGLELAARRVTALHALLMGSIQVDPDAVVAELNGRSATAPGTKGSGTRRGPAGA